MRLLTAFAVAFAWAFAAHAEPPPPVGWKGIMEDARIICLTPDQVATFVDAHNDPTGPVSIKAIALLLDAPAKCAIVTLSSEVTATSIVRLPNWDIGKGYSWPAYAIEIARDEPIAWVLYLDANPLLGM